jgi:hypothetical protein
MSVDPKQANLNEFTTKENIEKKNYICLYIAKLT